MAKIREKLDLERNEIGKMQEQIFKFLQQMQQQKRDSKERGEDGAADVAAVRANEAADRS